MKPMSQGEMMVWAAVYARFLDREHSASMASILATQEVERLRTVVDEAESLGETTQQCVDQMLEPSGVSAEVVRLAQELADAVVVLLMGKKLKPGSHEHLTHEAAWAFLRALGKPPCEWTAVGDDRVRLHEGAGPAVHDPENPPYLVHEGEGLQGVLRALHIQHGPVEHPSGRWALFGTDSEEMYRGSCADIWAWLRQSGRIA